MTREGVPCAWKAGEPPQEHISCCLSSNLVVTSRSKTKSFSADLHRFIAGVQARHNLVYVNGTRHLPHTRRTLPPSPPRTASARSRPPFPPPPRRPNAETGPASSTRPVTITHTLKEVDKVSSGL
ncbi:MAG: hypothetical protein FRX48_01473 [Lasallia pustulata]|uniref:Uncharacterized protein n=1 Tax=Lasallia pustulata TaxID=136370 RepID=A0A5M8PYD0_9LECA|nr:MAG: hypothetical protein FRX48_01473 [Lasallia pustulata]